MSQIPARRWHALAYSLCLSTSLLAIPLAAHAQDTGASDTGEAVTVIGSSQTRSVSTLLPSNLTVQPPGASVQKSLNMLPGVMAQSADALRTNEQSLTLQVRGFSTTHPGYTLDGMPLGDGAYNNYNGLTVSRALISENLGRAELATGIAGLGIASTSNLADGSAATPALAAGDEPVLVGVARIASDALDSQGETLGGMGSGMMLVPGTWHQTKTGFAADLDLLPDRGWNTSGTNDYQGRLQKFKLTLTPDDGAPPHEGQLALHFEKSLLFTDVKGVPTTGLDPVSVRPAANGLPDLPLAANSRVSLDDEAVAPDHHGGYWVGDEYGPYIYHYDAKGCMTGAIRPPEAFIPRRGGKEDFSANSPPAGMKADKGNPDSGRQNNQGLEGLSVSPDGRTLFAVNQSALRQDLDPAQVKTTRRNVRLLAYDIAGTPRLVHEYVIQLPLYPQKDAQNVAAQSELLAIDDHRFLLLCRDSGGGQASKRPDSLYRKVELVDIAGATDIAGRFDGASDSAAPKGVLRDNITPAAMHDFLDLNDNSQLNRFGLHNGAPDDSHDLYEKWESLALAPDKTPGSYILLVGSDNDFITQHGQMAGKPYADDSGANVDSLVMAWRVRLPGR